MDDDVAFAGDTDDLEWSEEREAQSFVVLVVDEDQITGTNVECMLAGAGLEKLKKTLPVLQLVFSEAFASLGIDLFTLGVRCLHISGAVEKRLGEVLELQLRIKTVEFLVDGGGETADGDGLRMTLHPQYVVGGSSVEVCAPVKRRGRNGRMGRSGGGGSQRQRSGRRLHRTQEIAEGKEDLRRETCEHVHGGISGGPVDASHVGCADVWKDTGPSGFVVADHANEHALQSADEAFASAVGGRVEHGSGNVGDAKPVKHVREGTLVFRALVGGPFSGFRVP